jgi:hypothetical protein
MGDDVIKSLPCVPAELAYHYLMIEGREIRTVQQRVALLKQCEHALRIQFSQSHASLADTEALEVGLVAVAAEIADLESTLVPDATRKIA